MYEKFNCEDHINYNKLVGEVEDIKYVDEENVTYHAIINLKVETSYKGKKHPAMNIYITAWDRLAKSLAREKIQQGDILHIEGRITVRSKKGKDYFGVTGNRIGVVNYVDGDDPFVTYLESNKNVSD